MSNIATPSVIVAKVINAKHKFICWGDHTPSWDSMMYMECSNSHIFKRSASTFVHSKLTACPVCTNAIKKQNNITKRIATIQRKLQSYHPHYTVLGIVPSMKHSRDIELKCDHDHEYTATLDSIYKGRGCPICAGNWPVSNRQDYVEQVLADNGFTLLTDVDWSTARTNTDITAMCSAGHICTKKLYYFLYNKSATAGCKQCANESHVGYYRIEKIDKEYLQTPAAVYVLKLESTDETFWKIGISVNVQNRLKAYNCIGYDIADLRVYDGLTLESAIMCESHILETHAKHTPLNHFSGHTECITTDPTNTVDLYIKGIINEV